VDAVHVDPYRDSEDPTHLAYPNTVALEGIDLLVIQMGMREVADVEGLGGAVGSAGFALESLDLTPDLGGEVAFFDEPTTILVVVLVVMLTVFVGAEAGNLKKLG